MVACPSGRMKRCVVSAEHSLPLKLQLPPSVFPNCLFMVSSPKMMGKELCCAISGRICLKRVAICSCLGFRQMNSLISFVMELLTGTIRQSRIRFSVVSFCSMRASTPMSQL